MRQLFNYKQTPKDTPTEKRVRETAERFLNNQLGLKINVGYDSAKNPIEMAERAVHTGKKKMKSKKANK